MNELMIVRRICELINHRLRDFTPLGASNFRTDCFAQLVERNCVFHSMKLSAELILSCYPLKHLSQKCEAVLRGIVRKNKQLEWL
ncbi:hypothetical protein D9M72_533670 [compost metagenome]